MPDLRFDPSTTVDVGLRSTKSANSIMVPAPFTRDIVYGLGTRPKFLSMWITKPFEFFTLWACIAHSGRALKRTATFVG